MLIFDFYGYGDLAEYADFVKHLVWFRMYCTGRFGNETKDYVKGFVELKALWEGLVQSYREDPSLRHLVAEVDQLIHSIDKLLRGRITDDDIGKVAKLLFRFEQAEERFREEYTEHKADRAVLRDYPEDLFRLVQPLFYNGKYDLAVLAAFRYLEGHIQKEVGVSPHDYFGENLINYAFSPQTGALQIAGHPNEQVGLRNFMSGAYAFFRNPSAHRAVKYDAFSAAAVVAMVAMMAKIVTQLAARDTTKSE